MSLNASIGEDLDQHAHFVDPSKPYEKRYFTMFPAHRNIQKIEKARLSTSTKSTSIDAFLDSKSTSIDAFLDFIEFGTQFGSCFRAQFRCIEFSIFSQDPQKCHLTCLLTGILTTMHTFWTPRNHVKNHFKAQFLLYILEIPKSRKMKSLIIDPQIHVSRRVFGFHRKCGCGQESFLGCGCG